MNFLPYIALLGIPVGICLLVYFAFSILKEQKKQRWEEICEKLSEEPVQNGVNTPLDDENYNYIKSVLEKATKIVKEEAADEAFYKQVEDTIKAVDVFYGQLQSPVVCSQPIDQLPESKENQVKDLPLDAKENKSSEKAPEPKKKPKKTKRPKKKSRR